MKIVLANDHRGVKKKTKIKDYLKKRGYEVLDLGTNNTIIVNYPEYAFKAAKMVQNKNADLAILICGTGIGMSIAANKVKGIRCAKIDNVKEAKLAKEHNNANAISISSELSIFLIKDMLEAFLNAEPNTLERYKIRNDMLDNYHEDSKNDN
ncbi:MAG TPA: RpiB/LacA/LacB family sugar-phosphate isomerase [Bacilli bacterium]|nr:RpiB/LacA/LacB family sugar-phosphate isomerase [Bacilli bacterium]